jgi:hypothetical protein
MGPQGEEIVRVVYDSYIKETNDSITFDEYLDKIMADDEFAKAFDESFEKIKHLTIQQRIANREKNEDNR